VPKDTLTLVDNRTGKSYEIPVQDGTIRAADLRQIKASPDDFGLMANEPGVHEYGVVPHAASAISTATRGSCDTAATRSSSSPSRAPSLETAYLLLHGELPSAAELDSWVYKSRTTHHPREHQEVHRRFHHDAHPMGVFVSIRRGAVHVLPRGEHITDETSRRNQIFRLIREDPDLGGVRPPPHGRPCRTAYPDND